MAFVLTVAFVNGCATVISKMINYRCTKVLGTNNGSLVNYVVASVLSLILLLVSSHFKVDLYAYAQAPWWLYLGGRIRDHCLPDLHGDADTPEGNGIHHPSAGWTAHRRNPL